MLVRIWSRFKMGLRLHSGETIALEKGSRRAVSMGDNLIDPVLVEVLRHQLVSVSEEMNITMGQTARSLAAKEGGDYSAALLDIEGTVIVQALPYGMAYFIETLPYVIGKYRVFKPGDIIISNDPFGGSSHLADIIVIMPLFYEGEHCDRRQPQSFFINFLALDSHAARKAPADISVTVRRTRRSAKSSPPTCARPTTCWAISTRRRRLAVEAKRVCWRRWHAKASASGPTPAEPDDSEAPWRSSGNGVTWLPAGSCSAQRGSVRRPAGAPAAPTAPCPRLC